MKPLLERWRAVVRPKTPAPMMAMGSDLDVDTIVGWYTGAQLGCERGQRERVSSSDDH